MYTLIAFATQWGTQHGGINSFNTDFLTAFGVAYSNSAHVVCIVASATSKEIAYAHEAGVTLVPLPYAPLEDVFDANHARAAVAELQRINISLESANTVWLGHDRFTGEAAIAATKAVGGRSALIHHMSYSHYESYAESSHSANEKEQTQQALFQQADLVLAVGPLLRDALSDLLDASKPVSMLIPGLAEIKVRESPQTFTVFLSGRLSNDAARIKQGHLGIAAFAQAQREACEGGMPVALCRQPKLVLRGVDFERRGDTIESPPQADPETELKKFAEEYAHRVINLHALPYTQNRQELYAELGAASIALMPSWHEGFGLVAWEAIAAGVPLIVSQHSGVYRLLETDHPGVGPGCVYRIDVRGAVSLPYFHEEDLKAVVAALKDVAKDDSVARRKAGRLRDEVSGYTWAACVEHAADAFGWTLQKGSIPVAAQTARHEVIPVHAPTANVGSAPQTSSVQAASRTSSSAPLQLSQGSPLRMPSPLWRPGGSLADSQLLRAEEALVPFDLARQPDLDALHAWLDDAQWPQAVRLITGAGGLGKTRLALELCKQRLPDWHAGLLDPGIEPNDISTAWRRLRTFTQSLLIVIDYAETRQAVLLALVRAMLQSPAPDEQRVRVLLLARDAGEWWDRLPSKDTGCEAFLNGYATSGPIRLPTLHDSVLDRRSAYRKALTAFAERFGVDAPNVVPELDSEHFGRPLYLQMAALLALHGERPVSVEGLTKALLNHEVRYWRGLLASFGWVEPERPAAQLLALATLVGGFATPKEAHPYWAATMGSALSYPDFGALFHALSPLYPGRQGLQPVRPDLLGEALVAQVLLRSEAASLLDAVLTQRSARVVSRHALTVLARLSTQRLDLHEILVEALKRHFAHCAEGVVAVATETTSHLPRLAEIAFARLQPGTKSQVAGLLDPLLRGESVQLAELKCLVTGYLVEKWRRKQSKRTLSSADMAHYAIDLGNHSVALSNIGRDDEALQGAQEVLNTFRKLAGIDHQRYDPDYASSLSNYANHLGEVGRTNEALEDAKQALEMRRRLAQARPDRYNSDYAASLNNYAGDLSHVGESEEALECAREALEINRRLAQTHPDYEPDYARSLSNNSTHLSEVGQSEEALAHAKEALEIHRRLAQARPDRYDPDYARSLSNYSNRLSDVGRSDEALEHAEQAVEIRRRLAQVRPDRYEPDYARSLSNNSTHLSEVGQSEEALAHAKKALAMYQRLSEKRPERFDEDRFNIACAMHFLSWLCDQPAIGCTLPDPNGIPDTIRPHRRTVFILYAAFVRGCLAADEVSRAEAFKRVHSEWNVLPLAGRTDARGYWLCAAAWCAMSAPEVMAQVDWQAAWRSFVTQRQGRVPHWMVEVARRLSFDWPT